jgi:hypothetical protein
MAVLCLSNVYPGLRPGLSSAVPAGLILQSVGSHAQTKALIDAAYYGMAEAVLFV